MTKPRLKSYLQSTYCYVKEDEIDIINKSSKFYKIKNSIMQGY